MIMFAQKPIYLSISQSRQLSAEMPIGDPFGGPAYGKRELFGIIVAGIGAFSGGLALAGGGLTILGSIAAGAALIGGALTIVGTLTGDANLASIGKTIGIVGSVANFATNFDSIVGGFESVFGSGQSLSQSEFLGLTKDFGDVGNIGASTAEAAQIAMSGGGAAAPVTDASLLDETMTSVPDQPVDLGGGGGGGPVNYADQASDVGGVTEAALHGSGADLVASSPVSSGGIDGFDNANYDYKVTNPVSTSGPASTIDATQSGVTVPPGTPNEGAAGGGGLLGDIGSFIKNNKELVNMFGEGLKYMSASDKRKADQLLTEAQSKLYSERAKAEEELIAMKRRAELNANSPQNPGLLATGQGKVTRTNSIASFRPV